MRISDWSSDVCSSDLVTITTAANAATGNGAAVTVKAAGGLATGISIAGASGAESVTLGDAFTVTNSAGSATGILLTDGSSQTVLSGGLNVAGVSATGAPLPNASGAVTFPAGGPLSFDGGSGGPPGLGLAAGPEHRKRVG